MAHLIYPPAPPLGRQQRGLTLIEVLMSAFVLTVGLVSMLRVFAMAMAATQSAQQDMIAKQLAQQAMETIHTARETQNISWNQIPNVGGAGTRGIFLTGLQPNNQPALTASTARLTMAPRPAQVMTLPGPDGIVGTADDTSMGLTNYQRSISITDTPSADLRQIVMTVQYVAAGLKVPRQPVLSRSFRSTDRRRGQRERKWPETVTPRRDMSALPRRGASVPSKFFRLAERKSEL